MTSPQGILLTVSTVWLVSGLLWRRWRTARDALTRLRTVGVFCGALLLLGFVLLPSVAIDPSSVAPSSVAPSSVEGVLYAVNVPFFAVTELYPPLWFVVLASLLCFVGVALSHLGDMQVLSLTMLLASVMVFAVGAGWWLEPLMFVPVTVSRGAVAWCIAVSVLVMWVWSRRAVQKETVFVMWALLVSSWLGLGLTTPGADMQLPVLTGYYTWLEPASSLASQTTSQIMTKQLAYGGWLLVAVSALSLSVAVAGVTWMKTIAKRSATSKSMPTSSIPTSSKALARSPARQSEQLLTHKNVWLEGTSLALFALIFTLALRYVINLDATFMTEVMQPSDALREQTREQTIDRLLNWRMWLRIVPPYAVQTWLVATLQTGAVALVVRTLAWLLQTLLLRARRVFRRGVLRGIKVLRVLLLVGFVVAGWLEWQPAAAVWLLALVAILDTNMQPTVVRSVLLGVLLGQGLGGLIGGNLQAGSGLGLLAVSAAIWGVMRVGLALETYLVKRVS